MQGEGAQAPMPVLCAAIERQRAAGECERVALAAVFSVDDPRGQLLEPSLGAELRQALEIEMPFGRGCRAIFLDE